MSCWTNLNLSHSLVASILLLLQSMSGNLWLSSKSHELERPLGFLWTDTQLGPQQHLGTRPPGPGGARLGGQFWLGSPLHTPASCYLGPSEAWVHVANADTRVGQTFLETLQRGQVCTWVAVCDGPGSGDDPTHRDPQPHCLLSAPSGPELGQPRFSPPLNGDNRNSSD